jgi:hypothetical protein
MTTKIQNISKNSKHPIFRYLYNDNYLLIGETKQNNFEIIERPFSTYKEALKVKRLYIKGCKTYLFHSNWIGKFFIVKKEVKLCLK